jgi:vacuolar-type H+-ATPase subunit H
MSVEDKISTVSAEIHRLRDQRRQKADEIRRAAREAVSSLLEEKRKLERDLLQAAYEAGRDLRKHEKAKGKVLFWKWLEETDIFRKNQSGCSSSAYR